MLIRLITLSSKMPAWVEAGFYDYQKRLGSDVQLQLIEIPLERRLKGSNLSKIQEKEAKKMLGAIGLRDKVVTLDVLGKSKSTKGLMTDIQNWKENGEIISLLVGGPEGLHSSCLSRANESWSLSALTLPHQLVKVVVAEQVYRVWSILHRMPYHK